MINLIFYMLLTIISIIISIGIVKLSKWLDYKLNELKLQERTLSDGNWFLKYELYRKGLK